MKHRRFFSKKHQWFWNSSLLHL